MAMSDSERGIPLKTLSYQEYDLDMITILKTQLWFLQKFFAHFYGCRNYHDETLLIR